jgi:hypothetical protein
MYQDKAAIKDLLIHFSYTNKEDCKEMILDEWAGWLSIDLTDQGEYWKGLEVFLFKMAEQGIKSEWATVGSLRIIHGIIATTRRLQDLSPGCKLTLF